MQAKNICWCCAVLGAIVVALAWIPFALSKLALTVVGLLIIVCNVRPMCCKKEDQGGT